jgi:hypothetical protein
VWHPKQIAKTDHFEWFVTQNFSGSGSKSFNGSVPQSPLSGDGSAGPATRPHTHSDALRNASPTHSAQLQAVAAGWDHIRELGNWDLKLNFANVVVGLH